jgi:hypothetical protein
MTVHQVFLSYCHRDDEPYGPQNRRWVAEFEKALRESIGQRVGPGRVEVWRDNRRLAGNELFDGQIEAQLGNSAILITVLSQHYLGSDYCKKEFRFFARQKLNIGGLHVDRLSRIVKVYRRAIDRADLRRFAEEPALVEAVDNNTGFELFFKDENGVDRDVLLNPEKAMMYWQCADDIALAIKRIVASSVTTAPAVPARQQGAETSVAVYLARTSSDMKERRQSLRRELEDRGYIVLPNRELPEDAEDYKRAVREDLKLARVSIHLLGVKYGAIPEGERVSGVALEGDLALQEQEHPLQTIFWAPPDLPSAGLDDPTQRAFVEGLERSSFDGHRAEFVRAPLEQLKALVLERLRTAPQRPASLETLPEDKAVYEVYLICDTIDRPGGKTLQNALTALGFEVTRPSMEGTPEELLEEHKANLVRCDAVVVVWGQSREVWVRNKLRDTSQAPGWGRSKAYRAKLVVVAPPDTPAKQDFDVPPGVVVLQASESTDKLASLLR